MIYTWRECPAYLIINKALFAQALVIAYDQKQRVLFPHFLDQKPRHYPRRRLFGKIRMARINRSAKLCSFTFYGVFIEAG